METVGLSAGIAGLAGFASQALEGIIELRAFFKDISLAPKRTADLLKDLESLSDTLLDIQRLVTTLEQNSTEILDAGPSLGTENLKGHLEVCVEDVAAWVKLTKNADPSSAKGLKAFIGKVKIAADKSGFAELGSKISAHQLRIGISLSLLGRYLDRAGNKCLDRLLTKVDGLTEAHLKLNDSTNTKIAASGQVSHVDENFSEILERQIQPLGSFMEISLRE